MKHNAVEELLAAKQRRIFALDHCLDARSAFLDTRAELEQLVCRARSTANPPAGRESHEMMRRYSDAERVLMLASVDLQRYHRCLQVPGIPVYVGHLERTLDRSSGTSMAFSDDNPRAEDGRRLKELAVGDWLRVWSPGREQILVAGIVHASNASCSLQIDNRLLSALSTWFDLKFPAEFAST